MSTTRSPEDETSLDLLIGVEIPFIQNTWTPVYVQTVRTRLKQLLETSNMTKYGQKHVYQNVFYAQSRLGPDDDCEKDKKRLEHRKSAIVWAVLFLYKYIPRSHLAFYLHQTVYYFDLFHYKWERRQLLVKSVRSYCSSEQLSVRRYMAACAILALKYYYPGTFPVGQTDWLHHLEKSLHLTTAQWKYIEGVVCNELEFYFPRGLSLYELCLGFEGVDDIMSKDSDFGVWTIGIIFSEPDIYISLANTLYWAYRVLDFVSSVTEQQQ
ncbi:MAG TPA: hypothetical protein VJL60_01880, partial [Gammaproteobacteria bacterium]|nr:hypothetical protein [Gammaproteobacteria bacterium]